MLQAALRARNGRGEGDGRLDGPVDTVSLFFRWSLAHRASLTRKEVAEHVKKEKLDQLDETELRGKIDREVAHFSEEWGGEIARLEATWTKTKEEIADIEGGKVDDGVLYEEYVSLHGEPEERQKDGAEKAKEKTEEAKNSKETVKVAEEPTRMHKRTRSRARAETDAETSEAESQVRVASAEDEEPQAKKPKIEASEETKSETVAQSKGEADVQSAEEESSSEVPEAAEGTSGTSAPDAKSRKTIQALLLQILSQLESHRYSSMFLHPVSETEEPEYFRLVHCPRDLRTIHRKVRGGEINSVAQLDFEVRLMLANAVMYNDMDAEMVAQAVAGVEAHWLDLLAILKESMT